MSCDVLQGIILDLVTKTKEMHLGKWFRGLYILAMKYNSVELKRPKRNQTKT